MTKLRSGSTAYFVSSLVRAFVSCNNPGGNVPNQVNASGTVPTCQPVETFHQQDGYPAGGWQFHNGSSYGKVYIKRTTGGGPNLGYPPTKSDAAVTLKLYHIGVEGDSGYASGTGSVQLVLRATFDDYENGDMTAIDFPYGFGFTLTGNGSVSVTKKVGDLLVNLGVPRFPDCTTLEVVSMAVRDPNGNIFAVPGLKF